MVRATQQHAIVFCTVSTPGVSTSAHSHQLASFFVSAKQWFQYIVVKLTGIYTNIAMLVIKGKLAKGYSLGGGAA